MSAASSARVTESAARHPRSDSAPYPECRRWAEDARAPWRQGGPAMLETRELLVADAPRPGTRPHPPSRARKPAGPRLPAWRRLDALQHRHPRPRDARVRGARRLLRRSASTTRCRPSRSFPCPLEQVVDVVRWLAEEGPALGIDAGRLAIGGDSAGANLSVATCLLRRDDGVRPAALRHAPQLRRVRDALLREGLPALRRPALHAGLRGNGRVLAKLPARRQRCVEPARLPAARIARGLAARFPCDRGMRHPCRAERRDGSAGCWPPACRHRASSIPARRTVSSRPCRLRRSATRALEDASRGWRLSAVGGGLAVA